MLDLNAITSAVTEGDGFACLSVAELRRTANGEPLAAVFARLEERGYLHLPRTIPERASRHILIYQAREAVASILMLQQEIEAPGITEDDREGLAAILALAARQLAKDAATGRAARISADH